MGRCIFLPNHHPPLPPPEALLLWVQLWVMLQALPIPASHSAPPTLPPCHLKRSPLFGGPAPSGASVSFTHNNPQDRSGLPRPDQGPPLSLQHFPGPSTAGPIPVWSLIIIKIPTKSSPLKNQHTPSAKEDSHAPGACDDSLPHLSSKISVRLAIVCLFCPKRERKDTTPGISGAWFHLTFTVRLKGFVDEETEVQRGCYLRKWQSEDLISDLSLKPLSLSQLHSDTLEAGQ